jgi:hypothetical protein
MTPQTFFLLGGLSLAAFLVALLGAMRSQTRWHKVVLYPVAVALLALTAALAHSRIVTARVVFSKVVCIANLKLLDGAKMTWALENDKAGTNGPTDADLFGAGKYLPKKPVCPQGGTYVLGGREELPKCSLGGPEHTLVQ